MLEELKEGLALKSVARVLKLYATALSGQEVAIRATTELQAVDAYGADHIILPPEMHFLEDDEGNFTAYKVATAHGAGRIEFGTYGFSSTDIPDTVAAPPRALPGDRMSTLARRPTTDLSRFYAIFPQPAMARDLFNIVEGHRVDSAIRRAYPGSAATWRRSRPPAPSAGPDLATLSDAQAVVESLLQHTLGLTPDLADVPPATQALIAEAVGDARGGGAPRARTSATPPPSPPTSTS